MRFTSAAPIESATVRLAVAYRLTAAFLAALFAAGTVVAQQDDNLLEIDPFDEITVEAEGKITTLRAVVTEEIRKQWQADSPPTGTLRFELSDRPGQLYEVSPDHVRSITFYEDLVLNRANKLTASGAYDNAFRHLEHLSGVAPDWPGLSDSFKDYLLKHAQYEREKNNSQYAFVLLAELQSQDSRYAGLEDEFTLVLDGLLQEHLRVGDFYAARNLLDSLESQLGENSPQAISVWRARWREEARQLANASEAHLAAGRLREAMLDAHQASLIWPETEGLGTLIDRLQSNYPTITVGVTQPVNLAGKDGFYLWGARRGSRLLLRHLFEFRGAGPEGGIYECPIAERVGDDISNTIQLKLWTGEAGTASGDGSPSSRDIAESGNSISSSEIRLPPAGEVARRIVAAAESGNDPALAASLLEIHVDGVHALDVRFGDRLCPESLLRIPLVVPRAVDESVDSPARGHGANSNGAKFEAYRPFLVASQTKKQTHFVKNAGYVLATENMPSEIIERYYPNSTAAVSALLRGEVAILDYVAPHDLGSLRSKDHIVVKKYAAPTLHVLIPNYQSPLLANHVFRRALLYGINRQRILRDNLVAADIPGCEVVDGPFPAGESFDDPLRYAFDSQVSVRGYEPALAMTLARAALFQVQQEQESAGQPVTEGFPALTLAHPSDGVSRSAAEAIRRDLAEIKIDLQLSEIGPNERPLANNQYDLVYAPLSVWEPISDAERMFGAGGLVDSGSPYLLEALATLRQETAWPSAREALKRIHQIVHREVTLIPLWQMVDHYAIRDELKGMMDKPTVLYQGVENWRIGP